MMRLQTTAYTTAAIALIVSLAAYLYASRSTRDSHRVILGHLATWVAAAALLALCCGVGARAVASRRWPLGTHFEFTLAFAATTLFVYLVLRTTEPEPLAGVASTALALLILVHALYVKPQAARVIQVLPPVLSGPWFALHTFVVAVAYGALTVAGGVALSAVGVLNPRLLALADRATAVGYVTLSLGMVTGGIWGELAWGDYWTWSIKETWTLVAWLTCTLYYHVRHRRGWRGRRAIFVIALIAAAVWANLFLTPTLLRWTRLQEWRIY